MTVYMKKVWGFSEPAAPLVFSMKGRRDSARDILKSQDLVVLVGTKGDPTDPSEQGRLLGIVEPTTLAVLSLDFDFPTHPNDYDEKGNFKWPFGLLNRRAWLLVDRPLLNEISNRRFNMDAASGIVALTDEEATQVLKLNRVEISVYEPSVNASARIYGYDVARKRAAPPPTTKRNGIMHMRRAPAYTYAMQVGTSGNIYKIGWAFDYKMRQRQFNQVSMPDIGGLRYLCKFSALWDTARDAYKMEQRLHKYFDKYRHRDNHEIVHGVTYEELQAAWIYMRKPAPDA